MFTFMKRKIVILYLCFLLTCNCNIGFGDFADVCFRWFSSLLSSPFTRCAIVIEKLAGCIVKKVRSKQGLELIEKPSTNGFKWFSWLYQQIMPHATHITNSHLICLLTNKLQIISGLSNKHNPSSPPHLSQLVNKLRNGKTCEIHEIATWHNLK